MLFSDFQKISALVQEFLSKLACEESTAELRDSLHLALFYLQRYYKHLRCRSLSDGISPRLNSRSFSGSVILNGAKSPLSPACGTHDQFEWKWYNLESPRLSTNVGTNQFSSLPVVLKAAKSGNSELLKETLLEGNIRCQCFYFGDIILKFSFVLYTYRDFMQLRSLNYMLIVLINKNSPVIIISQSDFFILYNNHITGIKKPETTTIK